MRSRDRGEVIHARGRSIPIHPPPKLLDFMRLETDDSVTAISRMGMGHHICALVAKLVAEEPDADVAQVPVVSPPFDPAACRPAGEIRMRSLAARRLPRSLPPRTRVLAGRRPVV